MKNKNKKLSILIALLLLGVGVSFAYFVGKTIFKGTGATLTGTTATLEGAKLDIKGELSFNDENIYPGHQTVSSITATAKGENVIIPFNLILKGNNSLTTDLNYTVYRVEEPIEEEVKATCEKETKVVEGKQQLSERCEISNIEQLGDVINNGTIPSKNTNDITIATDQFITATQPQPTVYYYYIILEYQNENKSQNEDLEGSFEGTVEAKVMEASADINILSINVEKEKGTFTEQDTIPENNGTYILDTKQSTCDNGTTLSWDNENNDLIVNGLHKTGTNCNLFFKQKPTAEDTLANLGLTDSAQNGQTAFSSTACSSCNDKNSGLFKGPDKDGYTYYYRGTVSNNWVKFGKSKDGQDIYWRIIRINGDGSIRLIYSGTGSAQTTGTETQISKSAFNTNYDDNKYVGYMYDPSGTNASQKSDYPPQTSSTSTQSTVLEAIVTWYNDNLKSYEEHLDGNAGFCGDRSLAKNDHGNSYSTTGERGYGTYKTVYGPGDRAMKDGSTDWAESVTPTFDCTNDKDLYTTSDASRGNKALPVPVGLITMDEVVFAGGYPGKNNNSSSAYYLYTSESYWTMSPYSFVGSYAYVFFVNASGNLSNHNVYDANIGVHPVINLKAGTLTKGTGTDIDPFTIE